MAVLLPLLLVGGEVGGQERGGGRDTVRVGRDTARVEAVVVVGATRGERRVEDTPLRVEVIDEEEIAEKVAMTPGDIAMMLNETAGLRVQATSPSLGGAGVRVQGLRGRYTQLLADGLPLYGGQPGGLGLLQIPPVDLGRVEVIKGAASALHGSAALGGVINLVSRRPGAEAERTVLVNGTTRGGADVVGFVAGPFGDRGATRRDGPGARGRWGYTVLAGAHAQRRNDLDADGWTDMPGYRRLVARPRLFHDAPGRSAFLTAGLTVEDRDGGTLAGRTAPDGRAFAEGLGTRRADVGGLGRWVLGAERGALGGGIVTVRGAAVEQRHAHQFGLVQERDRHRTGFAEAALALPRAIGRVPATTIVGAAFQYEGYRARDVAGMSYAFAVPAAFAQLELDPSPWLALSASARLDAHSDYGTVLNPRLSALLRRPDGAAEGARLAGWNARLSAGTGAFAPVPFTEETEVVGLTPVAPPRGLVMERARSGSLDVGGPMTTPLGVVEVNATVFGSRVRRPVEVREAGDDPLPGAARQLALANARGPVRTGGAELLVRGVLWRSRGGASEWSPSEWSPSGRGPSGEGVLGWGDRVGRAGWGEAGGVGRRGEGEGEAAERVLRATATYTYLRATECAPVNSGVAFDPAPCARREVPLNPRHAAGLVASVEQEGRGRVGLEVYYTGRQALDQGAAYRAASRPYVLVGVLAERAVATRVGVARVFVNLENLGDVRQTRVDPLVLPRRGAGGRWTTDVWAPLEGRVVNAGVRFTAGGGSP